MPMNEKTLKTIPRSIWALGFVSLLMDTSSELIHSLLPLFMVTTLGTSVTAVGIVEGIAEATALIVKIFSGTLSDYLGKRKLLTIIGYGLAAITKPLFPLANSLTTVLAARFIDRIGKGIRGAPRDALIGDLAPPEIRGACFGLRQSLDTIGAFSGPALAVLLMIVLSGNIHAVLWIATIPAFLSIAVLIFGVKEPKKQKTATSRPPLHLKDVRQMSTAYWSLVIISALFSLARFSEAFLVLKAQDIGLSMTFAPLIMVVMNIAYALSAYPAGKISDKYDRKAVLLAGIGLLAAADLILAISTNLWTLSAGVILWGLHMGFTQGSMAAMVTDTAQSHLRGTAYGIFNLASGLSLLVSSILAGILWDTFTPSATFLAGAVLAGIVFMCLSYVIKNGSPNQGV